MKTVARLAVRRSKTVLFGFIALVLLSTIWGFQSFGALKTAGYDDPGAASGVVSRVLENTFKEAQPDLMFIADFKNLADNQDSVNIGAALRSSLLHQTGIKRVTSYYTLGSPASLRSTDGKAVYFFAYLKANANANQVAAATLAKYDTYFHGARVHVAGMAAVSYTINHTISTDLGKAESFAVPIVMVLLLFIFGSLVSAGLPFLVAAIAALGSFFAIWVAAQTADTSVFAINLITGLALGLGIDYALLIVNRFREERGLGKSVEAAVEATVISAGRTVFFSGLTVAVVMLALGFFPQYFLRTFAIAGVSVVTFAVLGAIFALPAALNLLGDRVNKFKVLRGDLTPKETGLWEKISRTVMRRPLPILFLVLILLGGLASIAGNASFGQVDDRILPKQNSVAVAGDVIRSRFSGREGSPIEILLRNPSRNQLIDYTNKLSELDHVVRVQSPLGITQNGNLDTGYAPAFTGYTADGYVRVQAIANVEPRATDGYNLTLKVRALKTPISYVRVGGSAATYTDSMLGISNNLGKAFGWLIVATLILLFLFTGSVILPIKAVILNALSLSATVGFLTWVFQYGHLQWLIGKFQITGTMDSSSMVLVIVMAFGLSMDYELFLLSRIKEEHDKGGSTVDSVSYGLQHSGRIITTAAGVLAVSFIAFATSSVSIMKLLGLGVAFAILLDATVVRALLVPALMRLFGDFNWWAPKWLKKVHKKIGLEH